MLCAPSLAGCPFVLPFIEVEQNVPPTITQSSPGQDQTLVMETEQYTAFVVVRDPDDPELDFVWSISGLGIQSDALPIRTGDLLGSQLTLTRDAGLDGRELEVVVYDPAGATDRRAWTIEVPEVSP